MNAEIKKLEKKLEYKYQVLNITKEIAYGVGAGRIVNRKGYTPRDVSEVRANALVEVENIKSQINEIYKQLIALEEDKVGA
jgi:hypothetical protein